MPQGTDPVNPDLPSIVASDHVTGKVICRALSSWFLGCALEAETVLASSSPCRAWLLPAVSGRPGLYSADEALNGAGHPGTEPGLYR